MTSKKLYGPGCVYMVARAPCFSVPDIEASQLLLRNEVLLVMSNVYVSNAASFNHIRWCLVATSAGVRWMAYSPSDEFDSLTGLLASC